MDNGQWTMDNGQWTMDNGQWTMDNGQWTVGNGQWTMDNGQWTVGNGQWTMDSGQWTMAMDNGQWTVGEIALYPAKRVRTLPGPTLLEKRKNFVAAQGICAKNHKSLSIVHCPLQRLFLRREKTLFRRKGFARRITNHCPLSIVHCPLSIEKEGCLPCPFVCASFQTP
ncbi:MAG: hypothetical protein FWF88_06725 [Peptococcaceae bacterium]|nr:hypothetical protein [Peptococcaceae bacterium]